MDRIGNCLGSFIRKENDMKNILAGKKTYIVAALAAAGAVAQALGYHIPEYVFILLGAAGFGAVRNAIGR